MSIKKCIICTNLFKDEKNDWCSDLHCSNISTGKYTCCLCKEECNALQTTCFYITTSNKSLKNK